MLPEQLKIFREMVTLKDGTYVLLRPMVEDDERQSLLVQVLQESARIVR